MVLNFALLWFQFMIFFKFSVSKGHGLGLFGKEQITWFSVSRIQIH